MVNMEKVSEDAYALLWNIGVTIVAVCIIFLIIFGIKMLMNRMMIAPTEIKVKFI